MPSIAFQPRDFSSVQQQSQLNLEQIRQQFKAIFGKDMHLKRRTLPIALHEK